MTYDWQNSDSREPKPRGDDPGRLGSREPVPGRFFLMVEEGRIDHPETSSKIRRIKESLARHPA